MNFSETNKTPASRLVGIGFVVALHLLVFYALVSGLAREVVKVITKPIETKLIQEVQLPAPPPPPPPPKVEQAPPPQASAPVPRVEVQVQPQVSTGPTITASVQSAPVAVVEAPAPAPVVEKPHVPVVIAPVLNAATSCRKPVYPSASRREEEEGTVVLEFLVEADGLVSQSKVKTSSGFSRLDEAARGALSQCAFKPGTVDGKPHQAWTSMKYTWRLE